VEPEVEGFELNWADVPFKRSGCVEGVICVTSAGKVNANVDRAGISNGEVKDMLMVVTVYTVKVEGVNDIGKLVMAAYVVVKASVLYSTRLVLTLEL
jgi:hypothetical protein